MRKLLIFSLLCTLLFGCSAPQEPIFKRIADIRSTDVSTRKITITANAIYHNPNSLGGELTAIDVDVAVNDVAAAKIVQDLSISVPANSEFTIPLTFSASPKDIFDNNRNGAIGGIISAALSRKVQVHYTGNVQMKIAGIPYTLPVDYKEVLKLE